MLKVWGRRSSFNVQKVMWLVGELGLAHQHIDAGGSFGGLDAPEFLAMNPHGRVPVIRDDKATVWESHAILRYLAARDGSGPFWSSDPAVRAAVDGWMDWSQTSLQPDFLMGVFWGFYRTPEPQRNWPAIRAALARCARHFEQLERLLERRPFLLGDALTLADIAAGTVAVSVFRTGDRAAVAAAGRALVPHATSAGGVSRSRHDSVRGIARAAGLLRRFGDAANEAR
jgi:glutathione S-transferase